MTLSKLEKLLPLVDDLGLLPLLVQNKNLVLAAAPLLVEPAPALIPLVVNIIRSSPSTFQLPGFALAAGGLYETVADNALLGVPLVLLGAPLIALGSVLGAIGGDVPTVSPSRSSPAPTPKAPVSRPVVVAKAAPKVEIPKATAASKAPSAAIKAPEPVAMVSAPKTVAPKTVAPKIAASAPKTASVGRVGGNMNGKRKTIKI